MARRPVHWFYDEGGTPFGLGTIRAVEGSGDRTKLTVRFDDATWKKLMARYAGLEPLG